MKVHTPQSAMSIHLENESPLKVLELHVSVRFKRLFRCELHGQLPGEKRPALLTTWSVDVCTVPRLGRFVVFNEEHSLFTIIISSSYGRSLTPVLENFYTRREDLARELGLSEGTPLSLPTWHFGKRVNRHIIGSQNDLMYLLCGHLESVVPPVSESLLREIEHSLNQTPMSYLGMESPRAALFHSS